MMVSILEAIARMEGWHDPASRCRRNNNPGNIEAGRFATAHGACGSDERFATFPTPEAGFAAMRALLSAPSYENLTVAEAIARWAPANENDTAAYVRNVCEWCGCSPRDFVARLLAEPVTNA